MKAEGLEPPDVRARAADRTSCRDRSGTGNQMHMRNARSVVLLNGEWQTEYMSKSGELFSTGKVTPTSNPITMQYVCSNNSSPRSGAALQRLRLRLAQGPAQVRLQVWMTAEHDQRWPAYCSSRRAR